MDIRLVLVPLPKDGGRELALDALAIDMGPTKLDGFVERKLGAGKDTNCRRVTELIAKMSAVGLGRSLIPGVIVKLSRILGRAHGSLRGRGTPSA